MFDRAALEAAVARDIDAIMRACGPQDGEPAPAEPRSVSGCIHPIEDLEIVSMLSPEPVACRRCLHRLDREMVAYRLP